MPYRRDYIEVALSLICMTTILTEMEQAAMDAISGLVYAEYGFSDFEATEVSAKTGIDIKKIRGVVANLEKKGLIWFEQHEQFGHKKVRKSLKWGVVKTYQLIHLTDAGYRFLDRADEIETF